MDDQSANKNNIDIEKNNILESISLRMIRKMFVFEQHFFLNILHCIEVNINFVTSNQKMRENRNIEDEIKRS